MTRILAPSGTFGNSINNVCLPDSSDQCNYSTNRSTRQQLHRLSHDYWTCNKGILRITQAANEQISRERAKVGTQRNDFVN